LLILSSKPRLRRDAGDAVMPPNREIPFAEVAAFHGHVCPGLAIGFRMARSGLRRLADARAADEELVAVVENDACGVDAVQYLTGCTFGKGNLVFRDFGKQVYTFFHRPSGRAVRVAAARGEGMKAPRALAGQDREQWLEWLLAAPEEEVVAAEEVSMPAPAPARIHRSATCAFCGEKVMETRARIREGQPACIPCAAEP
jgi:formylmethanofuran dehydrogenase subunit E